MNTNANRLKTFMRFFSGTWLRGIYVVFASLAVELVLVITDARKITDPVQRRVDVFNMLIWIWIISPYLAILLASVAFRRWPRAIAVLAIGSVLCAAVPYLMIGVPYLMQALLAHRPASNPAVGGGGGMLGWVVPGIFQWILFFIVFYVTVLVTTMGPKSHPS